MSAWAYMGPEARRQAVASRIAAGSTIEGIAAALSAPRAAVAKLAPPPAPPPAEVAMPVISVLPSVAPPWAGLSKAERERAILSLRREGMTAAAIARKLGAPTANAINWYVTEAKRRGVNVAPTASVARKRPTLVKSANGLILHAAPERIHANDFKARAEARENAPGLSGRLAAAFDPLPGTTPRPFATNTGCKWPADGRDGKGLLCCGQPRPLGENYCGTHKAMSVTR